MPPPESEQLSTSVLADAVLPSLPGAPDPKVLLHSLVQYEVQIEGFFARGLLLGLQQRPRTAHSQQPQAREQPAPRAVCPGPTRHHPVAGARQLSLRLTVPWARGSGLPASQSGDAKEAESPGTCPGVRGSAGLGCPLPAQSHPTAATEERERGPGRTKRVSAAATAAAGTLGKSQWTESSPPTPDSGELLQTMRPAGTPLRTSSSLLPAESPAPTQEQRDWRLAAVVSCGTGIRRPHDRRGNSAESSSSASLPRTAQLLAALYNFLPCPNLAPRRGASLCSLGC